MPFPIHKARFIQKSFSFNGFFDNMTDIFCVSISSLNSLPGNIERVLIDAKINSNSQTVAENKGTEFKPSQLLGASNCLHRMQDIARARMITWAEAGKDTNVLMQCLNYIGHNLHALFYSSKTANANMEHYISALETAKNNRGNVPLAPGEKEQCQSILKTLKRMEEKLYLETSTTLTGLAEFHDANVTLDHTHLDAMKDDYHDNKAYKTIKKKLEEISDTHYRNKRLKELDNTFEKWFAYKNNSSLMRLTNALEHIVNGSKAPQD